jgi:MFS family permease
LAQGTVLTAVLISSVVQIPALLGFSALSDRYGRRGIYMAGAATLGLWSLFAFWPLVNTGSFIALVAALTIGQVFLSMMYGPQAAFYSEIFSTRMRYSGASLGYQLGAVLGGGLATVLASYLLIQFGTSTAIGVYMGFLCVITLVCTFLLTETYQTDMDDVEAEERRVAAEGGGAATS